MKKRFLSTLIASGIVGFYCSCDNPTESGNPAENVQSESTFQVETNNVQESGTGSASIDSDSLLILTGAFNATKGVVRVIKISIDTLKSGKYLIKKNKGILFDIVGGDIMANFHSTTGLPDDSISYEIDLARKYVSGEIKAVFVDSLKLDTLRLSNGSFSIFY